jgi:hypothetical protein
MRRDPNLSNATAAFVRVEEPSGGPGKSKEIPCCRRPTNVTWKEPDFHVSQSYCKRRTLLAVNFKAAATKTDTAKCQSASG